MLATPVRANVAEYQPALSPGFYEVYGVCAERYRLLDEFLAAVHVWNLIQSWRVQTVINGEPEFMGFQILTREAQERKDSAKHAWIVHVETHRCEDNLRP